jgi:6-phosphogluconolactonase (cycloisomerase 2 family)
VYLKYASGSVAFIPILSVITSGTSSGSIQFGAPVTIQLKYSELAGRNPARQESSHAHQAILHPTSGELLVPDLGADKVCRFKKTDTGKWQSKSGSGSGMDIQYEAGGGPRHVAFYSIYIPTLDLDVIELTISWKRT